MGNREIRVFPFTTYLQFTFFFSFYRQIPMFNDQLSQLTSLKAWLFSWVLRTCSPSHPWNYASSQLVARPTFYTLLDVNSYLQQDVHFDCFYSITPNGFKWQGFESKPKWNELDVHQNGARVFVHTSILKQNAIYLRCNHLIT